MNLAYYIFLLFIIFLLSQLIEKNFKLSPRKIRIYIAVVSGCFILRYVGLFLLCILKNSTFVYLLKPLLFLNHLAIPLIVLALSYVYLRWDKLNFNINYIIAVILLGLYIFAMYIFNGKVILNPIYGYIIKIQREVLLYLFSLIIIGVLLCFCVYHLGKANSNTRGIIYLILALSSVIFEDISYLGGIRIFPYPILSDAVFIFIINLGINTFKKGSILKYSDK